MRDLMPPLTATLLAAWLSGCAVGPEHARPAAEVPSNYKLADGWRVAAPADALDRGPWWQLFADPVLDGLATRVAVSNQNVAAAAAAYAQAQALVREQRALRFPTVSLSADTGRTGRGAGTGAGSSEGTARSASNFQLGIGSSWEPDVWGRLGRVASAADANAQASAADLASAQLSAQAELVVNYLVLRQLDAQARLLADTVRGYERVLQITQNRYNAGVSPKTDLLQAQTQLASARADTLGLSQRRAQLENAIAVLQGQPPANFSLAPQPWTPTVPAVPVGVPSDLLLRRPDIAAAERRVAVANEQIGVARSAFYPSINLSASAGFGSSRLADLVSVSTSAWSLGLSTVQTVFNAGAIQAQVEGARAAQQQAVARYRQTVLEAFQSVEDQLAVSLVLAQQQTLREQASAAADQVEAQVLNRYNAGQVGFTEVVNAQVTALNARRALAQVQVDRQVAAVSLVAALGGGWQGGTALVDRP